MDRGQAVLDSGILSVMLPITECVDNETGEVVKFDKHGDVVVEKNPSKKNKREQALVEPTAPNAQQKQKKHAKAVPAPAVEEEDSGEVYGVEEDSDNGAADDESDEAPAVPVKTAKGRKDRPKKVPVSAMTPEQLEEKRQRQKKKAPAEKDFALATIDALAAVEEKKQTDYLKKESTKIKHFEDKEAKRREKKELQQERAKERAKELIAERKSKLKQARESKKAMEEADEEEPAPIAQKKRKISFSGETPRSKKAKSS